MASLTAAFTRSANAAARTFTSILPEKSSGSTVWCIDWSRAYSATVVAIKGETACVDMGNRLEVKKLAECWDTEREAWLARAKALNAKGMENLREAQQAHENADKAASA